MTKSTEHTGIVTIQDLAKTVAFAARLTELQAQHAILAVGNAVVAEVAQNRAVQIEGFGMFDKGFRSNGEPAIRFRQHNNAREALRS